MLEEHRCRNCGFLILKNYINSDCPMCGVPGKHIKDEDAYKAKFWYNPIIRRRVFV